MKKNLVIGCVGPTSLHKHWLDGDRDFDVFLVYYGDGGDCYKHDSDYYARVKGTKFNIVGSLDIPLGYEYIFIPDDDLFMSSQDINRLFEYAKNYDLWICQPSLIGYYSVPHNLHRPDYVLRYTDYVEIIAPCFSSLSFSLCKNTFNYNKSCWGIEKLWDKELGFPQDKIAVIDDVIAIHTRPCFKGDNYRNNDVAEPWKDIGEIVEKHNLQWEIKEYGSVKKNVFDIPHQNRCFPLLPCISDICDSIFKENMKKKLI